MASARTYYVGRPSVVRRSDDLGTTWQDLGLSTFRPIYGLQVYLYDVMTDPADKEKVWVVGMRNSNAYAQQREGSSTTALPVYQPFEGIAYSTTGGLVPTGPGQAWYTPGLPAALNSNANIKEVWATSSSVVYACSSRGQVLKSTNANTLTPSFSLTTQIITPGASTTTTENCYSIHFPTPTQGAVGLLNNVYYTSDGGTTWVHADPGGLIALGAQEIGGIYYDPVANFMVAVSRKYIVRWQYDSTSSSYKFKIMHCFGIQQSQNCTTSSPDPNGPGIHLTWHVDYLGNLHMWATGSNDQVVYSADKGITWTTFNNHWFKPDVITGNPVFYPDYPAAHFYKSSEGFLGNFLGTAKIYRTVNGVETLSISDTDAKDLGAIWTVYTPDPTYRLDDCNDSFITIYTQDSSVAPYANTGQSIYAPTITLPNGPTITPQTCFRVYTTNPVQNLSTVVLATEPCIKPDCENCVPKCYVLTNCDNPDDVKVIQVGACNPNAEALETGIYQTISSPDYCNNTCFKLEPCVCGAEGCEGPYETFPDYLIQINVFSTCRQCNYLPEVTDLRPRSVKPGYYTPGCPPEYTEKTSCRFAEQVYDEMVSIRYGITICCDHDVDKWDIKMQLLQLSAIYNPDLCSIPITPPDPCENI